VGVKMSLDRSFRSRLRDAIRQSAGNPAEAGSDGAGNPAEAGSHEKRAEPHYEVEDDANTRADAEQAAWIADTLGGSWRREAGGVCLVVDREYSADRAHGKAEVGRYAEAISRHHRSLRHFDGRPGPADPHTLFSKLDASPDLDPCRPVSGVRPSAGSGRGELVEPRCPMSTSDVGLGTSDDASRLLFFDLETTGLSGGAGTCVFLVGYGWFEGDRFRTRQYFLSGYGHEAALLRMAGEPLGQVILTTFNGKTFDVPLIEGRYLFHRVPSPFEGVPHIDLLHPARRLWRHRPPDDRRAGRDRDDAFGRYFRMTRSAGTELAAPGTRRTRYGLSASAASCALGALEEAVLGFRRTGDVPGAEIPARYFHYVRTGDVRPLEPVLEHNRLDLLSLAAVTSVVARMLEEGPQATRNAHECLALGRLYEHSGAGDRATACYARAVDGDDAPAWRGDPVVQREALRRLALRHRRERRHDEAAAAWQRMLDLAPAQAALDLEALHALAVHHEHRSKDLSTARALVLRALAAARDARLEEALRHRLARIQRKLDASAGVLRS
jgi:uncharacterized protein YprB with RNaseH-like and TPR domain